MPTTPSYPDVEPVQHELVNDGFWGRFIRDTARAAAASTAHEYERAENIRTGLDVVEAAARAVNPNWWDREDGCPALGWHHRSALSLAGKSHGDPHIVRLDLEEAAAGYLALPFRVEILDRLLTDMLMASEIFAFADETQPQLKQKLPSTLVWLWSNLKSLVIGLSIAGVILWLSPDTAIMQWVAGIVAGLTLLGTLYSIVIFPFIYPGVRTRRQKFDATVKGMVDAYTALGGAPASVPHIRKLVDRGTDAGVVWPAPLMALLDDIGDRRRSI